MPIFPILEPARTDLLKQFLSELEDSYLNQGFPFAKVDLNNFDLDHDNHQVDLVIDVSTGSKYFFGEATFIGQTRCSVRFLKKHLCFKPGGLYSGNKVYSSCKSLEKTGLFEEVRSELGPPDIRNSSMPILLHVQESSPRSIGLGLSWSSQKGIGGAFDWSHENIWGEQEKFFFSAQSTQNEQECSVRFVNPIQTLEDISVSVEGSLYRGLRYETREHSGAIGSHLILGKRALQKIGLKLEKFYDAFAGAKLLFSLPFRGSCPYFDRNESSSSLARVWWTGEIFYSIDSRHDFFIKLQSGLIISLPVWREAKLRTHLQLHSIIGTELNEVPVSLRCFGGSPSVLRGYADKSVSPLNRHGIPVGGMSLLAIAVEPSVPLSKDLTFVPFLDLGQVYPHSSPNLESPFLYSIGLGMRKKVAIGSLRVDLGMPLQKRHNLDNPVELYILLGENF
ncbi:autotransporter assembly complex protein TamA [Candidatus Similichlamydia epinepheli]|uniref:autotransporter assembly complex protein TamA n=1 Tax=Candidatus Similichlamydia epinepheli TaxID=1903953 RepID=UPI000D371094|nr:BamA/TamA family outer membrane protein [Candidatus Similichlamydia epinepheli]